MKEQFASNTVLSKKHSNAVMFQHRAEQFLKERQSNIVIFDVASISIECYLIAICEFYKTEPRTHNYQALMEAVELISDISFPPEISKQIRALDKAYGICSIDNYQRKTDFNKSEISQILQLCTSLSTLSEKYYSHSKTLLLH
ncbi:hypothetical protein [Pectinatus brassicae]|uniref:HEPN domain-containing protein n=1 Tax=Pectinatus brassicae TaxID=862415 RepID=A0A840UM53_9FIRM|nr:hypothetical protein [Pectinatus brassicae]MBB5337280.1 HEPN domain-containing protein [Pectinatus brassicae]